MAGLGRCGMSGTLYDHLTAIRAKRGALAPDIIVEEASDPAHPLHQRFDWDDSVAAHRWRLEQASHLIRVVKLPGTEDKTDLRAFVAVKREDSHKAVYVPTQEAMADEFTRRLVLRDMERDVIVLKRRYEHMREFAEVVRRHLTPGAEVSS